MESSRNLCIDWRQVAAALQRTDCRSRLATAPDVVAGRVDILAIELRIDKIDIQITIRLEKNGPQLRGEREHGREGRRRALRAGHRFIDRAEADRAVVGSVCSGAFVSHRS